MPTRKQKRNNGFMIIVNAFLILIKAIFKAILSFINWIIKLENKLLTSLQKRYSKKVSVAITTIITFTVIFVIGLGVYCGVRAYQDEMQRQYEQKLIEEENARLEAQRIAKEEEEARIAAEEKAAQEFEEKKTYCALNLQTLNLASKYLDVDIIYQYPEFPSGCECVSLTNMLNYYGFKLSKSYLIKNYLEYDSEDFVNYYRGDPYDEYWGGVIMSPGLLNVARNYLGDTNTEYLAYKLNGMEFEDLFAYIERGNPVQIWSSLSMGNLGDSLGTYEGYTAYTNSHSVLLTGFNRKAKTVSIADPIEGERTYDINTVKKVYNYVKKQAVVILTNTEVTNWANGIESNYK